MPLARSATLLGEFVAIYFPTAGARSRLGAHVTSDLTPPAQLANKPWIALFAPYRFLASVLPTGPSGGPLPPSACLRLVERYLDGLLKLGDDRLCNRQATLAAEAVRALLASAQAPGDEVGLGSRRRASLLTRLVAYIDAHLHDALSVKQLCDALNCSRSAIYRATEGADGVAGLVTQRRMLALRDRLSAADEARPIAELAADHGFPDAAQFSRRFKALFGTTPGEFRRDGLRRSAARPLRRAPSAAPQGRRRRSRPCR